MNTSNSVAIYAGFASIVIFVVLSAVKSSKRLGMVRRVCINLYGILFTVICINTAKLIPCQSSTRSITPIRSALYFTLGLFWSCFHNCGFDVVTINSKVSSSQRFKFVGGNQQASTIAVDRMEASASGKIQVRPLVRKIHPHVCHVRGLFCNVYSRRQSLQF